MRTPEVVWQENRVRERTKARQTVENHSHRKPKVSASTQRIQDEADKVKNQSSKKSVTQLMTSTPRKGLNMSTDG
jgi:transcription initiation factor IIF auxiliary subunit